MINSKYISKTINIYEVSNRISRSLKLIPINFVVLCPQKSFITQGAHSLDHFNKF